MNINSYILTRLEARKYDVSYREFLLKTRKTLLKDYYNEYSNNSKFDMIDYFNMLDKYSINKFELFDDEIDDIITLYETENVYLHISVNMILSNSKLCRYMISTDKQYIFTSAFSHIKCIPKYTVIHDIVDNNHGNDGIVDEFISKTLEQAVQFRDENLREWISNKYGKGLMASVNKAYVSAINWEDMQDGGFDDISKWIKYSGMDYTDWMKDLIISFNRQNEFALKHILYNKSDLPKWLRKQSKNSDCTFAMYWVKHVKTNPPDWMHHDSLIKSVENETCAMLWIMYVKTDPPEWMHHDSSYRCMEMPKVRGLLYNAYMTRCGFTLAMHWINSVETDPPEWMRHDKNIRNKLNGTLAMLWIKCVKTDPPEWMHHDSSFIDYHRETCAMHWIKHVKTDPPEWMHHDKNIKNYEGKTCEKIWIKYNHTDSPEWMKCEK